MEYYVPAQCPKKCCIPNCVNKYSRRHRFPKTQPDIFKAWVEIIKPPRYQALTTEQIYNQFYVCDDHFSPDCFVPGTRRGLKVNAIPKLISRDDSRFKDAPSKDNCFLRMKSPPTVGFQIPKKIKDGIEALEKSSGSTLTDTRPLAPVRVPYYLYLGRKRLYEYDTVGAHPNSDFATMEYKVAQRPNKCCVRNCDSKHGRRHRFPKNRPETFKAWLEITKPLHYQTLSVEKIYNRYYVCDSHFAPECFVPGSLRGLKVHAIPTLNISQDTSGNSAENTLEEPVYDLRENRKEELIKTFGSYYKEHTEVQQQPLNTSSNAAGPIFPNRLSAENGQRVANFAPVRKRTLQVKKSAVKSPSLPSRRTVAKLLKRSSIRPGFHNQAFSVLKAEAENSVNTLDQYCILMFDEISLWPNLQPNYNSGTVEGFEDFGFKKTNRVADRAQVFMLRGINHQWQQPIYYTFVSGEGKAADLVEVIKLIVRKCNSIGLKIIATVCDHASTSRAAIHALVKNTHSKNQISNTTNDKYHFEVDGQVIIPLFDVPHLFIGIRNELLKHNLQFMDGTEIKLAKWSDIYTVYKMNRIGNPNGPRLLSKLTDSHVMADKINKMDVSKCVQVFSTSVASAIHASVHAGTMFITPKGTVKMEKDAADTATLLSLLDQLFDSLNVNIFEQANKKSKKLWRHPVTDHTVHTVFWNQAVQILDSFRFVKNESLVTSLSVKYLKITIKNFGNLWQIMKNIGFESLMPRTFQQEPLDKFLKEIRQRAHHNTNLTSVNFTHYYKNLVINRLLSYQSIGINYEAGNSSVFRTLQHLVSQGLPEKCACTESYCTVGAIDRFYVPVKTVDRKIFTYVAGLVLKKIGKQSCDCKSRLFNTMGLDSFANDSSKEKYCRTDIRLMYVNSTFLSKLKYAISLIKCLLNRYIYKSGILEHIFTTLCAKISFTNCFHDDVLKKRIFKYLLKVHTFNYCKQLNEISMGFDKRSIPKNAPLIFKTAKKTFSCNIKRRKAAHQRRIMPVS